MQGLNRGEAIVGMLADRGLEGQIKFYCGYLPLEHAIKVAMNQVRWRCELTKRVLKALAYPMVLLLASMGLLLLFTQLVMPAMNDVIGQQNGRAAVLVGMLNAICFVRDVLMALIVSVTTVITVIRLRHRQAYAWMFLHRLHLDRTIRVMVTFVFVRWLDTLLDQGVALYDAVQIIRHNRQDEMAGIIAFHFDQLLRDGVDFETSLSGEYFDDDFHALCLWGLKSDDFHAALSDYISVIVEKSEHVIKTVGIAAQLTCYGFVSLVIITAYQVLMLPLEMLEGLG